MSPTEGGEQSMSLLNVQAVSYVGAYANGYQDYLSIYVIVSDAAGNPVTDLTQDDFTLVSDGSVDTGITGMGHGELMVSLYELTITPGPAPAHFSNGTSGVLILVGNGTDHGQTIVLVDIEGRPVEEDG
jgi:hypothetical protein